MPNVSSSFLAQLNPRALCLTGVAVVSACAISCGSIDGGSIDGGSIDGGSIDGGSIDGGSIDDGAMVDVPVDAVVPDLLVSDASNADTSDTRAADTMPDVDTFDEGSDGPLLKQYFFVDFLPLKERKAGTLYIGNTKSASWVVNPAWGAADETQVQFREPGNTTTWSSDVWQLRSTGPLGLAFAYLTSHVARMQQPNTNQFVDVEFKLVQIKAVIKRYIAGKWHVDDVTQAGAIGIPYARSHWKLPANGTLRYVVQNWYYALKHNSTAPGRYFFHQQEIVHEPGTFHVGPSWQGPGPKSRECIVLSEAIWQKKLDTGETAWAIGGGSLGSDGIPDGTGVTYGRSRCHAYKVGSQTGVMAFWAKAEGNHFGTRNTWTY